MMDYGILIIVYSPMLLQIIYYTFVKSLMFPAYFENNVSAFTRIGTASKGKQVKEKYAISA